jgi:hypothetical protein
MAGDIKQRPQYPDPRQFSESGHRGQPADTAAACETHQHRFPLIVLVVRQ